jgi:hypothetical protein
MNSNMDESTGSSKDMATLSQVMEQLRQKKIGNEFSWKDGRLFTLGKGYGADQLTIVKTYRFEGDSNPDDSAVLYILQSSDGVLGYTIDSYGVYSDHEDGGGYDNFIRKIKVDDRDGQLLFQL